MDVKKIGILSCQEVLQVMLCHHGCRHQRLLRVKVLQTRNQKKTAGLQTSTKGKGKKNKKNLDEDDEPMDPNHTPIQGGKNNDDDEEDDILDDIPDDLAPPPGASKKRPAAQPRVQKRPASRHHKQDDKVGFTVHRSFG